MITTAFLAWLYLFRNDHFYFVRNMFMVAMGLALVGYALFPTAPPRMFPGDGFTDTIAAFTSTNQDSSLASLLVNPYAAVPSMHIAFSLMIAVAAITSSAARGRGPSGRSIRCSVFFVIVVTANHYWFDAAARRGGGLPGRGDRAPARAAAPRRLVVARRRVDEAPA